MDYNEIKTAAYGFADRTDAETLDRYDDFLRIVEAKINRVLKTLKMTSRATIPTVALQEYYGLPDDFDGMRDLQIIGTTNTGQSKTITCQYMTPAQLNEQQNTLASSRTDGVYYSIITDQLQIYPPQNNNTIEMVYYKRVPVLSNTILTNWLSIDDPDCYIFGVLTEINAFNKDAEAASMWSERFKESLSEIQNNDVDIRWGSGDMMVIRTI